MIVNIIKNMLVLKCQACGNRWRTQPPEHRATTGWVREELPALPARNFGLKIGPRWRVRSRPVPADGRKNGAAVPPPWTTAPPVGVSARSLRWPGNLPKSGFLC